mmetsp:Transcript_3520/g.4668  ORF Transcript_3520/g.4668 Transcript_3520/m.4668 type:complete len:310 (+) Transcript_3520:230-1159(+)|eukprot:CAMPEP_0198145520 /NCGR_PEP_ID=MMETSP1443-20131203/24075_1 /TAXON_ID=186043 /ORGANISM="Entomoneis sp., Strain CCMP2396" /LENGTH=309 /DNA_ID=CAMNT_0043809203 /DNA_START=152 /DNA_END=1081 /DNA_ORIENTATION=+
MIFRSLQAGNCVGDAALCEEEDVLLTITTASSQDILIIVSAVLSFSKSLLAIGTYSYFHVAFSLLGMACTVLAFIIFISEDYDADFLDQVEAGYGDDVKLYLLSFCGAIVIEWVAVITTYQTVVTYKRIKAQPETYGDDRDDFERGATAIYVKTLLIGLALSGIVPLIAFGKAGWETDYFGPVDFGEDNAKLVMCALILWLITQGLMAIAMTVTAFSPSGLMVAVFVSSCVGLAPILASGAIMYTVLTRVDGKEAGGLCYLLMINVVQSIEFSAEFARHVHWLQIELLGKSMFFREDHRLVQDEEEEEL